MSKDMKPIIFSTQMVKAILGGRKTQRRMPIVLTKPYRLRRYNGLNEAGKHVFDWAFTGTHGMLHFDGWEELNATYNDGDILWVRETWMPETEQGIPTGAYIYKATDRPEQDGETPIKWRPSIHMPREAARIFLRVTNVRAERLCDISTDDIISEGIRDGDSQGLVYEFYKMWDSIYSKRGYGWDKNPWVWVYAFRRIEKEEAYREAS